MKEEPFIKYKDIIIPLGILILIIIFTTLGFFAGGQEICKKSDGVMVKGFRCINVNNTDYCKDRNMIIYEKLPNDYDNYTFIMGDAYIGNK